MRYILLFQGQGPSPQTAAQRLGALGGVRLLDDSSARTLLVEVQDTGALGAVERELPGWSVTREQMISRPNPRKSVRRRPGSAR